jgi:hypothetical protein
MLLKECDRPGSDAERDVLASLSAMRDVPGLALANCYIRNRHGESHQADLVVFTKTRCVVVEVKGLRDRGPGVVTCRSNGDWEFNGRPAQIYGTRNPFRQVRDYLNDVKDVLRRQGAEPFVDGLVALVPWRGEEIRIEVRDHPKGVTVVDGRDERQLREALTGGRGTWSAEDVHRAVVALEVGDAPGVAELAADGFDSEQQSASGGFADPHWTTAPPSTNGWTTAAPPAYAGYPPDDPRSRWQRRDRRFDVVWLIGLAVGAIVAVYIALGAYHSDHHREPSGPQSWPTWPGPTESITGENAAGPGACFPFQVGC